MDKQHIFLAAGCNTPGCTADYLLKYLGHQIGYGEYDHLIPPTFRFLCPDCKQWNNERHHDEVFMLVTENPPPPGFDNTF